MSTPYWTSLSGLESLNEMTSAAATLLETEVFATSSSIDALWWILKIDEVASPAANDSEYDASGQRVRKFVTESGTVEKERVYLGSFEVYRQRMGGSLKEETTTLHISDDGGRMCMVERKTVKDGSAVAVPTPKWRFQLSNHLGSSATEVTEDGDIISHEEYHPYGTSALRSTNGEVDVSAKRYRYTGQERDEETGLYYHGARYYAAWLGRWTATDPIGLGDGMNRYAYVSGNPVGLKDPGGMLAEGGIVAVQSDPHARIAQTQREIDQQRISLQHQLLDADRQFALHQITVDEYKAIRGGIGFGFADLDQAQASLDKDRRQLAEIEAIKFRFAQTGWAVDQAAKISGAAVTLITTGGASALVQGAGALTAADDLVSAGRSVVEGEEVGTVRAQATQEVLAPVIGEENAAIAGVAIGYVGTAALSRVSPAKPTARLQVHRGPTTTSRPNPRSVGSTRPDGTGATVHDGPQAGRGVDGAGGAARPVEGGGVTVYRVEGTPNTRVLIGESGEVAVTGKQTLFLNFGNRARAEAFLEKRLGQGMPGAEVKSFEVPQSFLDDLRAAAVPESKARLFPDRPIIADPTKAPDQFGLRPEQIEGLQSAIRQGSGKRGL